MEKIHITDLWIKGFQSHKDTHIEFVNGFNAVVGPTNAGKSAVIRTIRFILFNILDDPNFMTRGMDSFEGTVALSNGKRITRKRIKKENFYELEAPGEEPVIMTGFGGNPVDEVMNFHGMKPIKVAGDNEYITMQGQHDSPFFLTDTPAKKAAMIGSIAKTDIVDSAIADLALDLSRKKSEAKEISGKIEDKNKVLKEYENLVLQKDDLDTCNSLLDSLNEIIRASELIKESNLNQLSKSLLDKQNVLKRENDVVRAEDIIAVINEQVSKRDFIKKVFDNCADLFQKLKKNTEIVHRINDKDIRGVESRLDSLTSSQRDFVAIKGIAVELSKKSDRLLGYSKIMKASDEIADTENKITIVSDKRKLKLNIESHSEDLDKLCIRYKKGLSTIVSVNAKIDMIGGELKQSIEDNPICPICNSDLRGMEVDLLAE